MSGDEYELPAAALPRCEVGRGPGVLSATLAGARTAVLTAAPVGPGSTWDAGCRIRRDRVVLAGLLLPVILDNDRPYSLPPGKR